MSAVTPGYVLLEDGSRFDGLLCGETGGGVGEVVFNTAMTGYQEAVTDPSYAGQIITFTYPMIGNYGVSADAMESGRAHARGVIMRDARNSDDAASAEGGWLDWLEANGRLGDHRGQHQGAGPSHPRQGRDARRNLPGSVPKSTTRSAGSGRSRRWPGPTSPAP